MFRKNRKAISFFFKPNFLGFFFHLSFIAPDLEIFFFSFQGLESVSQEAILVSEAGEKEKRKQKGNVRNKMSLKRTQCMPL